MEKDVFPEFKIVQTPAWLRRIGGFFCHLQHKGLSEHFIHPLDSPLEPVVDWPLESDGITDALLNMNQVYFPDEDS